jgi:hypothetical protein
MPRLPLASTLLLAAALLPALAARPVSAATLDIDLLAVSQQRNVVQIPNTAQGTRFSLVDVLGSDAEAAARVTLVVGGFGAGQQWRFIAAPFSIEGDGTLATPVDFNGTRFAAGPVRASYTFNSYRATYRWPLVQTPNWTWHAGLTAKVRDAEIALRQGVLSASKKNTGVVPLLHVAAEGQHGNWRFSFDADALASGQGRAIDVGLRGGYALTPSLTVFAGLRVIEGGSDNDEVYNFAQLNQASIGLRASF